MTRFNKTKAHPPTRWFRLAQRLFPSRCREIPHAEETDRCLIRQFAIIRKYLYLQQFASGEGYDWAHSHSWTLGTLAIGLSGALKDYRHVDGRERWYRAPYFRYMGPSHIHATTSVMSGHTSLFIGLGPKDDTLKNYFLQAHEDEPRFVQLWHDAPEVKLRRPWHEHIKRLTKRI